MVATMIKKIKDKKLVLSLKKFYKSLNNRLEELSQAPYQSEMDASALNDTLVESTATDETLAETSISKPSLLEMGSDGKKMNMTYISRNVRVTHANTALANQMSSIDLNDYTMDTTVITTPCHQFLHCSFQVTDTQSQQSMSESASAVNTDVSQVCFISIP